MSKSTEFTSAGWSEWLDGIELRDQPFNIIELDEVMFVYFQTERGAALFKLRWL